MLCSPLLLVEILAADPSSGSPPGCHRTGSGHGDPGDLEALEALTLRRFCGRVYGNLEEKNEEIPTVIYKKINVMTVSSDQDAR